MDSVFTPIETYYKDIRFRSRLEATWACFFDLLGWRWEYEPVDFKGWIPDFALYGSSIVYVEVKPVVKFPQEVADEIDRSGCCEEALIIGQSPNLAGACDREAIMLGWLREVYYENDQVASAWGGAVFGLWSNAACIGFCHEMLTYNDRISGLHDGGCYGARSLERSQIQHLWAKAKNATQWRKSR